MCYVNNIEHVPYCNPVVNAVKSYLHSYINELHVDTLPIVV